METIGFRAPLLLFIIPIFLGAATLLLLRFERHRKKLSAMLGLVSVEPRSFAIAAPILISLPLLIALCRPYIGFHDVVMPTQGGDLMIVLDTSLSMEARDAPPNRLEAAKRKALDTVDWIAENNSGTRIGITLFAGSAHQYCPLTADYDVVRQFIRAIRSSFIASGGSGLLPALEESLRSLGEAGSPQSAIMLLSDGEDSSFNRELLSGLSAITPQVAIIALGFGSNEGGPIPTNQRGYLRDRGGNLVISRRQGDTLRQIAEFFSGEYREAQLAHQDIIPFLTKNFSRTFSKDSPRKSDTTTEESTETVRVYNEKGPFISFLVLVALGIAAAAGQHRALLYGGFIVGTLCSLQSSARSESSEEINGKKLSAYQAYQAYQRGEFESARNGFREALTNDPDNLDLMQGEASSAFRLKDYRNAEELFAVIEKTTTEPRQRFEALYNRGNALLAQQRYTDAIAAYDDALVLNPGDEPTRANRAIAEQLKIQEKKEEEEQQKKESQKLEKSETQSKTDEQKNNDKGEEGSNSKQGENDSAHPDDKKSSRSDEQSGEEDSINKSSNNNGKSNQSPLNSTEGGKLESKDSSDTSPIPNPTANPSDNPSSENKGSPSSNREDASDVDKQDTKVSSKERETSEDDPSERKSDGISEDDSKKISADDRSSDTSENRSIQDNNRTPSNADRWLAALPEAPVLLRSFDEQPNQASDPEW